MHPYPPSHFGLLNVVGLFLGPAIVLGVTGWFLWSRKRPARSYDAAIWLTVSTVVLYSVLLLGRTARSAPAEQDRMLAIYSLVVLLAAVPVGGVLTFTRLIWRTGGIRASLASLAIPPLLLFLFSRALPLPSESFDFSARDACMARLQKIALIMLDENKMAGQIVQTVTGDPPVSWRVHLLPQLGEQSLFSHYNLSVPWNAKYNANLMYEDVDFYQCPAERFWSSRRNSDSPTYTSYVAAIGPHAMLSNEHSSTLQDVSDGHSNTVMLLEACGQGIIWSEPRDIDISQTPLGVNLPGDTPGRSAGVLSSLHPGGAFVAMGDGRVDEMGDHTDPEVLRQLLQRDDGKPVGNF